MDGQIIIEMSDSVLMRDSIYSMGTKARLKSTIGNERNWLYIDDNNEAYLQVRSFAKSDKKFFKKVFKEFSAKNISQLNLNLAWNSGGNRKAAVALTSYLVTENFHYDIVQYDSDTDKYFDEEGQKQVDRGRKKYSFWQRKQLIKNS